MDEKILSKITLTPAEKQVLIEQSDSAVIAFGTFQDFVRKGDVKGLVTTWADMTAAYEFMSNILNMKTQRAVHLLLLEQGDK